MEGTQTEIAQFERKWGLTLPESFINLYRQEFLPEIGECHFESLEGINAGSMRWKGMFPYFIPFAEDAEGDIYGFYRMTKRAETNLHILQLQEDGGGYVPISSGGRLFLERQMLMALYNAQDEEDISSAPHNEKELHDQLHSLDPLSSDVLLYIGASHLADKKYDSARKMFQRAIEAAPWFADAHGILALLNQMRGKETKAVESWIRTVECPIFLSSNFVNYYHAGLKLPETEMIEWASEQLLAQRGVALDSVIKSLANCLFNTFARVALASELQQHGDSSGEERELLNALALAVNDIETNHVYDNLIVYYDRAGDDLMRQRCIEDKGL